MSTNVERLIVEAGAGCGKTYSLTEHYLKALGIDMSGTIIKSINTLHPNEIVALTFTEQAAKEMKERILTVLKHEDLSFVHAKVSKFGQISTFHSYCYKILENHLDGLGYTNHKLSPESLSNYQKHQFILSKLAEFPQNAQLLKHFSVYDICQIVKQLWLKENHTLFDSAFYEQQKLSYQNFVDENFAKSQHALAQLSPFINNKEISEVNWIQQFSDSLASDDGYLPVELNRGKGVKILKDKFPHLLEAAKQWRQFNKDNYSFLLSDSATKQEQSTYELMGNFLDSVHNTKKKHLDFDALEYETLELLKKDPSAINPPKLLIVDEFQDTNARQLDILERLSQPTTNWYFVGDPKQSIYRFRQANVALFMSLKETLTLKQLSTNYRSYESTLIFLNQLQSVLFDKNNSFDPEAQSLIACDENKISTTSIEPTVHINSIHDPEINISDLLYDDLVNSTQKNSALTHGVLFLSWNKLYEFANYLRQHNVDFTVGGTESLRTHPLTELWQLFLQKLLNPEFKEFDFAHQRWFQTLKAKEPEQLSNEELLNYNWSTLFEYFCHICQCRQWHLGLEWCHSIENYLGQLIGQYQHLHLSLRELLALFRDQSKFLEIQIKSSNNATSIQLFTIHGSKGLQFDYVYLPEFYSRKRSNFQQVIDQDEQQVLGLKIYDDNHNAYSCLSYQFEKNKESLQEESERKRLFYVATTRTKKFLYCYFNAPKAKKSTPTLKGWELLGWPQQNPSYWNEIIHTCLELPEVKKLQEQGWLKVYSHQNEESDTDDCKQEITNSSEWILPNLIDAKISNSDEFFREGVSKYIARQFPEEENAHQHINTSSAQNTTQTGNDIHRLLELWNGDLNTVDELCSSLEIADTASEIVKKLAALPELAEYWDTLRNSPNNIYREYGLFILNKNYRLSGFADVLWIHNQDHATLIDWKTTSKLRNLEQPERIEKINWQLKLYKQALGSQFKKIDTKVIGIQIRNPVKVQEITL